MGHLARALVGGFFALCVGWPAQAESGKAGGLAPAAAPWPKGNALAGKAKAEDERCVECHGHDGNANDIEDGVGNIGKFPRLAGQQVGYIIKQFAEFRSGKRSNDTMAIMAKTVADADLADIAAYFASQKLVAGDRREADPLGRNLFLNGDAGRGILPCAGCHTPAQPEYPRLAGQHRRYLQKQLIEWRAGERRNSPGGIMNAVAQGLTDREIDALADYVSSLQ
ncbi:MAG: cytochrome c4 [Proteobacteria bacterium]|nr:cytochrome c4 [Pseudomonadota bacterium]